MPKEHEDVEATLEQGTTPDAPQQKGKWRAIDWIAGSTLVAEALLSIIWTIVWAFGCRFEHQLQVYLALVLFILTGGYLALIFCPIFKKDDDPRWFHARILSSGIVGGSYAFLLPVVMSLPEGNVNSGGAAALRQAILLATGGLIALIALGETRRKNDNDREAAENLRAHQENMLIQQKEQFEANSFKERKAERRERYTKAVEQLGSQEAPVRMGGVYTLVGLVDEWLEEESIRKYEDRLKEGQVIINNLCAYIRSPFTLATRYDELSEDSPTASYKDREQEFYTDKATLDSEADVRLGIIKEIHDRLQGPRENTPGTWSDFDYDFSGSTFFYSIDLRKSYYTKSVTFRGSTYHGRTDFSGSTYQGEADFSGSTYEKDVTFNTSTSRSIYLNRAVFSGSTYQGRVYFSGSTYQGRVYFSGSTYQGQADFSDSTYQDWVYFSGSTYQDWADFRNSTYQGQADFRNSTYQGEADFSGSTYKKDVTFSTPFSRSIYLGRTYFGGSTYQGEADFGGSTYEKDVTFSTSNIDSTYSNRKGFLFSTSNFRSTYLGWANFSGSIYLGWADFSGSTYKDAADFSRSIFYQETYFGEDGDNNSFSRFTDYTPKFYNEKSHQNTLFGSSDNDFTVDTNEGYPINLNSEGLPLDCKLLTSEQKEYLENIFQEIEKINNKLLDIKDPEENTKILDIMPSLNEGLHTWRKEATTVKAEDIAAEDTES